MSFQRQAGCWYSPISVSGHIPWQSLRQVGADTVEFLRSWQGVECQLLHVGLHQPILAGGGVKGSEREGGRCRGEKKVWQCRWHCSVRGDINWSRPIRAIACLTHQCVPVLLLPSFPLLKLITKLQHLLSPLTYFAALQCQWETGAKNIYGPLRPCLQTRAKTFKVWRDCDVKHEGSMWGLLY